MARPRFLTEEEMAYDISSDSEDDGDFSCGSSDVYEPDDADFRFSSDSDTGEEDNDTGDVQNENEDSGDFLAVDPMFTSKNKIEWSKTPLAVQGRARQSNVISLRPGVTRYAASRVYEIKDAFLLFFPPPIEDIILENTNAYGRSLHGENFTDVTRELLHAYIAVLILAGVYRLEMSFIPSNSILFTSTNHSFRSKNERIRDLFDAEYGRPVFRSIMSREKFNFLTRIIRFDDVNSRRQSRSIDKFAPIRELWERWTELLPMYFNPHECVTIDEQLCGFHGRCKFRQYMPSKPERYGLKFWLAVDADTCYVWKIQPYLGKEPGAIPEKNQGARVVLDLVDGLKGHNVTMDNFFSSYELGQKMLSKKLTMVGTMRKNKASIPPKLLLCKKLPLYESTFAFTKDTTLVSYIGRRNKCTVLQSTMHNSPDVGGDPKKLPEIISYYNKTKGGVDTVDKMLSCYSCKRKTNRWPMSVFSNMIDISALNAYIIYNEVNPNWHPNQSSTKRKSFLHDLGLSLARGYMVSRPNSPKNASSQSLLERVRDENDAGTSTQSQPPIKRKRTTTTTSSGEPRKRARCVYCVKEKGTKNVHSSEIVCSVCDQNICKAKHNINVCTECR